MSKKVAIVNYGMGNMHSIFRKLTQLGIDPVIATTTDEILAADKIILPGVGHFEKAINNLKSQGLFDGLNEAVLIKKKPILGICLGMQLMAKHSQEGDLEGFGWFDAEVVKFHIQDKFKYKVPQTGWNTINFCKPSKLLANIPDKSEFYFLHSYHFSSTRKEDILAKTDFEYEFVSAVEKENIFATQFHPEKSHEAGIQMFKNFINL